MKPPLDPVLLISALGMFAVGLAAVLGWRRRAKSPWVFFGIGALAWTVGVALKVAWALPANKPILAVFSSHLGRAAGPASWLYVGLLTGVFEVGATWLFVRYTRLRRASGADAMAFGLGFGAIEAVLLGGVSFVVALAATLFWSRLPSDLQSALATKGWPFPPWMVVFPVLERAYTILAHAVSCILVIEGVQQRRPIWLVVSFAYKTLVDGIGAWGIMAWSVRSNAAHFAWFELMLCAFVVASALLVRLARHGRPPGGRAGDARWPLHRSIGVDPSADRALFTKLRVDRL
jgi:uncharacterized membrane protein YhfC